jgi:hypothetical protein
MEPISVINQFSSAVRECSKYITDAIIDVREKRCPLETGFIRVNELQIQLEAVLFGRPISTNPVLEMLIQLCDEARDVLRKELS